MALELVTKTIIFNSGGNTAFGFSDTIQQYVVGISGFTLSYSQSAGNLNADSYWVQTIGITLDVVGVYDNTLYISPNFLLYSGAGNFLGANSSVTVTIFAWTGSVNNDNLILASNIQNQSISLPSTPLLIQPVLSGFSLSFGMYPQNPTMINIGVGVSQMGSNIQTYGYGNMYSNHVFCETEPSTTYPGSALTSYGLSNSFMNPAIVNTGLIVNCDPSLTTLQSTYNSFQNDQAIVNNLPSTVKASFLTGFTTFVFANTTLSSLEVQAVLNNNDDTVTVAVNNYCYGNPPTSGWVTFVTLGY